MPVQESSKLQMFENQAIRTAWDGGSINQLLTNGQQLKMKLCRLEGML